MSFGAVIHFNSYAQHYPHLTDTPAPDRGDEGGGGWSEVDDWDRFKHRKTRKTYRIRIPDDIAGERDREEARIQVEYPEVVDLDLEAVLDEAQRAWMEREWVYDMLRTLKEELDGLQEALVAEAIALEAWERTKRKVALLLLLADEEL